MIKAGLKKGLKIGLIFGAGLFVGLGLSSARFQEKGVFSLLKKCQITRINQEEKREVENNFREVPNPVYPLIDAYGEQFKDVHSFWVPAETYNEDYFSGKYNCPMMENERIFAPKGTTYFTDKLENFYKVECKTD